MEERLTRRDRRTILALLGVTAAALLGGILLFPRAFPEASIRFTVDAAASLERARVLLAAQDLDPTGYLHAERFTYDARAKVFLERELGLARADSAFSSELRLWRWSHRWFRPRDEGEFRVAIATSGELAEFTHVIGEAEPAGEVAEQAAREQAEAFLRDCAAIDVARLELVGSRAEVRPRRTDRTFTWEYRDRRWAGAPLRVEVTLQGDRLGRFRVGLRIPEDWERGYAALRSRNEALGAVATLGYGLLILALVVGFVRRIPQRAIQWRAALLFSLVGMGLILLGELNGFRASLWDYDTRQDWSSFLVTRATGILAQCAALGLFIFLLAAGGEPAYRESYPEQIALGGLFTRRGVRTRRFLLAVLSGYALAAVFVAYQAAFYCLAAQRGAWAPADVPYDDLLNTSLPWAFVLLVGFIPAVTEEFSARLFAIPWLSRALRSRVAAVVVSAAVWGFAHAGYPNQPYYIRGLEVGLAGLLVGVVFLRCGVLAVLVWHYSVDAGYAAYLLLRSQNPYFVVSGALAAGALALPLAYALGAYLRRGRFASPEGMRNRDLPPAEPAPPAARGTAEAEPPPSYTPLSRRRVCVALLISGFVAAAVHWVPVAGWGSVAPIKLNAGAARDRARAELVGLGAPLESLRVALWAELRAGDDDYRYGAEVGGTARARELLSREIGPAAWQARAFAPERAEEWRVALSAADGALLGFEHRLAETAPGDTLAADSARALAERFLPGGLAGERWSLVDARAVPRPARRDHVLVWEARDSTARLGDGAVRQEIGVWGGRIGRWQREFKLPDDWRRAREERTPLDALRTVALGLLIAAALAHTVQRLLRARTTGRPAWRSGMVTALVVALVGCAGYFAEWPALARDYDTSQPWRLFLLEGLLLSPCGILALGLLQGMALSLLPIIQPGLRASLRREQRRRYAPDALRGLLVVVAAFATHARLAEMLRAWIPGSLPRAGLALPPGIAGGAVWLAGLGQALSDALSAALIAGGALFLLHREGRTDRRGLLLVCLATLALLPAGARQGGEVAAAWGSLALGALIALALARWVLRGNPVAYLLACLAWGGMSALRVLWMHPATRADALVLGVILIVGAGVWLLRGVGSWPRRRAAQPATAGSGARSATPLH